ncbi:hypothetical protein VINI7043_14280 [Vibrio nigripulchritudo ATCC 27043]|nr:hypothetical protein VINI7043_14280 [Vibrio nigripulchritudo ATCC 27043]
MFASILLFRQFAIYQGIEQPAILTGSPVNNEIRNGVVLSVGGFILHP